MINKNHKTDVRRRVEEAVWPAITRENAAGSVNRLRITVVDKILKLTEELEKSYGNCQSCYGKGYATVHQGLHGAEDFGGDGFDETPTTKIRFCHCLRGTALKRVWGKTEGLPW